MGHENEKFAKSTMHNVFVEDGVLASVHVRVIVSTREEESEDLDGEVTGNRSNTDSFAKKCLHVHPHRLQL